MRLDADVQYSYVGVANELSVGLAPHAPVATPCTLTTTRWPAAEQSGLCMPFPPLPPVLPPPVSF